MRMVAILACAAALWNGSAAAQTEVRVAAAADLARAFREIAGPFERANHARVTLVFGATGLLARQIEQGAPFDVFAAADERHLEELERAGRLLPGTRRLYAIGRLAIWTRAGHRPAASLQDLAGPAFARVAIANPEHAPYGAAAVAALRAAGVYGAVSPRLVYGENVQQTMRYAESGAADAAIVSYSLAMEARGRFTVVPQKLYAPIRQGIAAIHTSGSPLLARLFVATVTGPAGRAVLARYGFTLPGVERRPAGRRPRAPRG